MGSHQGHLTLIGEIGGYPPLDASLKVNQVNSFAPLHSLPTRAVNTNYLCGSRPRIISISVTCDNGITVGANAYIEALTDTAATPTTKVGIVGLKAGLAAEKNEFNLTFFVKANEYYRVTATVSSTGVITKTYWTEMEL